MKKQAESVCKSGGVTSGYYAPVNIWNSKRSARTAAALFCYGAHVTASCLADAGSVTMKQKVLTNRENMT